MSSLDKCQAYARSLLEDIQSAATGVLPRREILLNWLDAFLQRTAQMGFQLKPDELDTLLALDRLLRVNRIPARVRRELE
jgi:hypothetical protein